jgi:hypothetical protein
MVKGVGWGVEGGVRRVVWVGGEGGVGLRGLHAWIQIEICNVLGNYPPSWPV